MKQPVFWWTLPGSRKVGTRLAYPSSAHQIGARRSRTRRTAAFPAVVDLPRQRQRVGHRGDPARSHPDRDQRPDSSRAAGAVGARPGSAAGARFRPSSAGAGASGEADRSHDLGRSRSSRAAAAVHAVQPRGCGLGRSLRRHARPARECPPPGGAHLARRAGGRATAGGARAPRRDRADLDRRCAPGRARRRGGSRGGAAASWPASPKPCTTASTRCGESRANCVRRRSTTLVSSTR